MSVMRPVCDPERGGELLARQASLQSQAHEVVADLSLMNLLTEVGRPMLVGSVATGLMVWRDVDFIILSPALEPARAWDAMRPLASHPSVKKLSWSNVRGSFNATGRPEIDGYYFCIHYQKSEMEEEWKIDCWFVPMDAPRPEAALIERLAKELTEDARAAILRIKDAWCRHPDYLSHVVCSVDIYTAVLDNGVRTPEEFEAWLRNERNK